MLLLLIFRPVGRISIAGQLFPVLLDVGLPIYLLLVLGAMIGAEKWE